MSITAKQYMIKTIVTSLRSELTACELDTVQDTINDVLEGFEVEANEREEFDAESNDLLEAFLDAKRIEGRSENTLRLYQYRITQLMQDVGVSIRHITVYHLRKYLTSAKDRGIAPKTLAGMRSIYCSFFGWLHGEGLIKENPCSNLAPIKVAKVMRLPYSDVDLELLRDVCDGARNKAIVAFLLSTGCRVSEMCALNRDDIDFDRGEVVVFGKGAKERTVFLNDIACLWLRRYLDERVDTYEALFVGRCSERLKPNAVRKMLHDTADKAGVQDVHPHRFRRTLATNLIARGMPIQEVAAVLGHDKLDTTMTYIYLDKTDIHNHYKKYA